MDSGNRKTRVVTLSVASSTFLMLLKLIVGVSIGSVSVISEAIHSGVDLLASTIVWFAVRTSDKPADADHPFGHGKVENISGTVEGILIFGAAAWIVYESIKKFMHPAPLESAGLGIVVMLISALMNTLVSRKLFKVGKATSSVAVQADAWHLRTDVFTSIGVMAGLLIIWLGRLLLPGVKLNWVDPAAAIVIAVLIARVAYDLIVRSAADLLDVTLPEEEQDWIKAHVRALSPTVRAFHRLRTRKSGAQRFIQFHLLVDGDMSVDESHRLNDRIVAEIKTQFPDSNVTIHIEPCRFECTPDCAEYCLLDEKDRHAGAVSS